MKSRQGGPSRPDEELEGDGESDEEIYIYGFETEAELKGKDLDLFVGASWRDEEERICLIRL